MKQLVCILLIALFGSCASNEKSSSLSEDFKVTKELPYKGDFEKIISERSGFFKETTDGLEDEPLNSDDIIDITTNCRDRNFSDGLEAASRIYGRYKKWPTYWNAIGICYYLNSDFYKAKLYFNRALEANTKYAPALNNLGLLLIKNSEWEAALLAFKSALKRSPKSQVINYNIGRLYLAYGHGSKALKHFIKINDSQFYRERLAPLMGVAHSLAGQHSKAINILESLYQEETSNELVKLYFAHSLKSTGKRARAKKVLGSLAIGSNNANYPLYYDLKRGLN